MLGEYNRVGVSVVHDGPDRMWVAFDFLRGPSLAGRDPAMGAVPVSGWQAPAGISPAGAPAAYEPVAPRRVLDTRSAESVQGGVPFAIDFAGAADRPTDASGAVLNVTVTEPAGSGYLTVYPCGGTPPNSSNINFTTGENVPNLVPVGFGDGAKVCAFSNVDTDIVVDLAGWLAPNASQTMQPRSPLRLIDTRDTKRRVQWMRIDFNNSLIPREATAVSLNLTVTDPKGAGYLTAYPCRTGTPPLASNVNFGAGETKPNMALVVLDEQRQVCFYASTEAHVVVDLTGSFGPDASLLQPVQPVRLLDTRGGAGGWLGRVGAGQTIELDTAHLPGMPLGVEGDAPGFTITTGIPKHFNSLLNEYAIFSSANFPIPYGARKGVGSIPYNEPMMTILPLLFSIIFLTAICVNSSVEKIFVSKTVLTLFMSISINGPESPILALFTITSRSHSRIFSLSSFKVISSFSTRTVASNCFNLSFTSGTDSSL